MTAADTAAHAADVAELRRLEQAATPRPWEFGKEDDFDGVPIQDSRGDGWVAVAHVPVDYDDREVREANAALIAAARNALPALLDMADKCDALAVQLAKAEARCGELVEALADIGAAIVEQADDTLWVGLGETCVDRIGTMLGIGENSDLDELLLARRAAKALAPAPNGEKGADDA